MWAFLDQRPARRRPAAMAGRKGRWVGGQLLGILRHRAGRGRGSVLAPWETDGTPFTRPCQVQRCFGAEVLIAEGHGVAMR